MPEELFLGVDGGGSHTLALVADGSGRILGRGLGGPANLHAVGEEAAQGALRTAIEQALSAAGSQGGRVAVACLGLAGVGRAPERETFERWAAAEDLARHVRVVVDCDLVLAAGTPHSWGLALIAGTGSIVWGRDPAGRCARAGGWGYLLGDEGSGYAVGLAALQAVVRAADGRGPVTTLTEAILAHWGLPEAQALVGHVYRAAVPRREIGFLAPLVEAAAEEGDAAAQEIVRTAGDDLARALAAVARSLALAGEPIPLALGGGLLVRGRLVAQRALEAATELGLALRPVTRVGQPALGALRLAQGEVAVDGTEAGVAQLKESRAGDEGIKG